jgi:hypothetical protein
MNGKLKNTLLLVGAVVSCPCHLLLWAGLLAGTSLGAFLTANFAWVFAAFTVAFVLILRFGFPLWTQQR